MTTAAFTPPPVPPAPRPPRPSGAARAIALLTVALGAVVVIGAVWGGAVPTIAASVVRSEDRTLDVAGVDALDLDVAAAGFTLAFDDVPDASLEVRDTGSGAWTFEVDGSTLRVHAPDMSVLSWFGAGNGRVTLTLPRSLEGADLDAEFGAGSFTAAGEFGAVSLRMGAGQATLSGTADALEVDLSAGQADLALADVRTADLTISAGAIDARLTGTAPRDVRLSASAGSIDLELPDETYAVTSDASGGSIDNTLRTDAAASRTIAVEVSAGEITLTPGR